MKLVPHKSTFIVTGGASGLGLACVQKLFAAPYHCNVVLVDLNEEQGKKVQDQLNATNSTNRALFCKVNITKEDEVQAMVDRTVSEFSTITGLINCAGVGYAKTLIGKSDNDGLSLKAFKFVLDVNLVGNFNVIAKVARQMVKQDELNNDKERGVIINTASVAAFEGQRGQISYSASKGGVVSMTLPMARELSRYGIRVVCVAPGLFLTPMMKMLPAKAQEGLAKQVPFPKRMGHPEEFAQMCLSVIENPMLNGTTIRLDGSIRMSM